MEVKSIIVNNTTKKKRLTTNYCCLEHLDSLEGSILPKRVQPDIRLANNSAPQSVIIEMAVMTLFAKQITILLLD